MNYIFMYELYFFYIYITNMSSNTKYGEGTLQNNTIGSQNTAIGTSCLQENANGNANTAVGAFLK